ncbi:MAG: FKBP-type peptidyl-prolyl cis-trans isomerase [Planctomycetota bacterium]|jgi:FKBP-type peptidyl-prolyl cis-trans isomerase
MSFRHASMHCALVLASALLSGCDPPDVQVTETPISMISEDLGFGDPVNAGDVVWVDYRIRLPDGNEVLRQTNFRFQVGAETVIEGIDEAIVGMRAGGSRHFTCPPHKHWGRAGYGDGLIPPATDLDIVLKLDRVESRARGLRTNAG